MATKTHTISLPCLLIALSLLQATLAAVRFGATNNASSTLGGQRFDRYIGIPYTLQTMPEVANFIWKLFQQPTEGERRHYYPDDVVNVIIQDLQDGALGETGDNNVYMSAKGIETYPPGDGAKFMFTSILYHEMTHIFQWSGKGTAPGGLTEGMADYTVLKSPFYVEGYSAPWEGEGERWDEGYGATSRFLEYCDSLREGFTPELNRMMREVYMPEYWNLLFGKDVDQVWGEYNKRLN
ncbi:uncharacterized protein LOC121764080 [Salvia splendens]|uniref:uncharacterized protein LOC121764080 n=1 Tax=Salvia splendens TaxID=180675 RepID=UPI001C274987|nr:uncharacterized protein LOC121764080 [Salvia splendens]